MELGNLIIHRILSDVHDNQFLYVEKFYIILAIDEKHKQITVVPAIDWISGYQRDLAYDYDNLIGDGFSIDILDDKDVKRSGIYKKLDLSEFETIGFEYSWLNDGKEVTSCVPYVNIAFNHKLRGHSITTYEEDFSAAMAVYPDGDENYIFGKRYTNFLIAPFNVEDNIYTLGNKLPKK